jgi:hypothetical protein
MAACSSIRGIDGAFMEQPQACWRTNRVRIVAPVPSLLKRREAQNSQRRFNRLSPTFPGLLEWVPLSSRMRGPRSLPLRSARP